MTLRIQVTVMLLKERYTLIQNFTIMTSVTLEGIDQCILHGLWHDCIIYFYFRRLFMLTSWTILAPSNLQGVVLCGVLSKGDGSLSR